MKVLRQGVIKVGTPCRYAVNPPDAYNQGQPLGQPPGHLHQNKMWPDEAKMDLSSFWRVPFSFSPPFLFFSGSRRATDGKPTIWRGLRAKQGRTETGWSGEPCFTRQRLHHAAGPPGAPGLPAHCRPRRRKAGSSREFVAKVLVDVTCGSKNMFWARKQKWCQIVEPLLTP